MRGLVIVERRRTEGNTAEEDAEAVTLDERDVLEAGIVGTRTRDERANRPASKWGQVGNRAGHLCTGGNSDTVRVCETRAEAGGELSVASRIDHNVTF